MYALNSDFMWFEGDNLLMTSIATVRLYDDSMTFTGFDKLKDTPQ